jgi:hypothetical protein
LVSAADEPQHIHRHRAKRTSEFVRPYKGLTEVPNDLEEMTHLRVLRLENNSLKTLGSLVGRHTELEVLSLSFNELVSVPPEIGQLVNLRMLWLESNQLSELPPEIGQLIKLEMLHISGNNLTTLPAEIGQLVNLRQLLVRANQLTSLPKEIGQLINLRELTLDNNELSSLPSEIGKLANLSTLTIDHNNLTSLPREIGQLTSLSRLSLDDNKLATLPAELGFLKRARPLSVARNHVRTLPGALADIAPNLVLDGNPLAEPLPELIERGLGALMTYLRSLRDGVQQYEAKLLLLGEGKVGKTSLVAALLGEPFVENRPTTHGIKIRQLTLRHPEKPLDMTLRAWDFGGQEVYRVTHQFFLSSRALYVVVWSAREGREQDDVEGWLRRIRLRVGREARVLLVASYCDERNPELDYPSLQRMFPQMLAGRFSIDNSTNNGIDDLRRAIAEESARLPHMGSFISKRWLAARAELLDRSQVEPQIDFRDFAELCKGNGLSDSETDTLAALLHDLGQIVYYGQDEGLRDIVVLKPEWLTNAISQVLEDARTKDANGVLDHGHLREIWLNTVDGESYPVRYHPYFLRLMEKYDISYRLEEDDSHSLIAQLAPHERPHLPWDSSSPLSQGTRSLSLICRMAEPAPGLIAWLTVRHHASSTGKHWRKGVFLRHPVEPYASEALIELTSATEMFLQVRAPSPDLFFHVLRDSIEGLIRRRWSGVSYELLVPCPTRSADGMTCRGSFSLNGLLIYREQGGIRHSCLECIAEHDVSMLLTGFTSSDVSLQPELLRLRNELAQVATGVGRIERYAAETADSVRRVLGAVSQHVTDCPRLFSVSAKRRTGTGSLRFWRQQYRVTLWCEHSGHEHVWRPAEYTVANLKDWLRWVGPYAAIVVRILQLVVPVAAAVEGRPLNESRIMDHEHEFELMTTLTDKLPRQTSIGQSVLRASGPPTALTEAENDALRAFRSWLFSVDRDQRFGGLRRVQDPSGHFLWVCVDHYRAYDPGLPTIPGSQ